MPPAPKPRPTFPRVMTSSTWDGLWGACFKAVVAEHGKAFAPDGTLVPPLTNGEAVQLIMAWRRASVAVIGGPAFQLWGQYAAHAYGWTADNGTMDINDIQRAKPYTQAMALDLWLAIQSLATRLDAAGVKSPRLSFVDHFEDATVQGAIAADLAADGVLVRLRLNGGTMAPAPKPQPKRTPAWVQIALIYFGYRVLKNITGGPKYSG